MNDFKIFKRPLTAADFATPEARGKVFEALNLAASGKTVEAESRKLQAQMQAFGTVGDFETTIHSIVQKYQALPMVDVGYEQVFDMIDARQSNDDGFTIYDIESGMAFSKVPIGLKAHVYSMSGTKAEVGYDLYGSGLGWSRVLFEDRKFWQIENNAKTFINQANYTKAGSFYALIEAVPAAYAAQRLTWQLPEPAGLAATDPTYTANRDAQTLNAAAVKIFADVKDKGYGVNYQTPLKVVCPFQLIGRLNRALGLLIQGFGGSPNQVSFTFQLVPTMLLSSASYYYVCLPKNKLVGGNRKDLEIFPQWNPESYTDQAFGWMRFGGAAGDTQQIVRCDIS